jgi:hypothetical protein
MESKGTLQGSAHTVCAHVKQDFIVNLIYSTFPFCQEFLFAFSYLQKCKCLAAFPNLWITYTMNDSNTFKYFVKGFFVLCHHCTAGS